MQIGVVAVPHQKTCLRKNGGGNKGHHLEERKFKVQQKDRLYVRNLIAFFVSCITINVHCGSSHNPGALKFDFFSFHCNFCYNLSGSSIVIGVCTYLIEQIISPIRIW